MECHFHLYLLSSSFPELHPPFKTIYSCVLLILGLVNNTLTSSIQKYLPSNPWQAHKENNAKNVLQGRDEDALDGAQLFARAFLEREAFGKFAQLFVQLCKGSARQWYPNAASSTTRQDWIQITVG